MTQHSQNGEGVEVLRDSANSHCFDDRIMVAGECIAFASEPWSSKIAASLAREPATADVGRVPSRTEIIREWVGGERYARDYEYCDANFADKADRILALFALSRAAPSNEHSDDTAVNRFAAQMKAKLAKARAKGRGGWDDPAQCSTNYLRCLLYDHLPKGDPIDVANFCMMLAHYGASTAAPSSEPIAWCSPGQLANLTDVDADGGVYLPIRKTERGNFTMPLYAAPSSEPAIAEGERVPSGSFACPICGDDKPHHHTAPVVGAYQMKGSRPAPMQCPKCGVGGGGHDGLCPDATVLALGVREAGTALATTPPTTNDAIPAGDQ